MVRCKAVAVLAAAVFVFNGRILRAGFLYMEKLKCYVISHTHWAREWYQSFQNYRYRLVRFMDNLIESLSRALVFQFLFCSSLAL